MAQFDTDTMRAVKASPENITDDTINFGLTNEQTEVSVAFLSALLTHRVMTFFTS